MIVGKLRFGRGFFRYFTQKKKVQFYVVNL